MLGTNYKEKKCKGGLFRDKIVKTSPFKKFMKGKRKKKVVSIEKNTIKIYIMHYIILRYQKRRIRNLILYVSMTDMILTYRIIRAFLQDLLIIGHGYAHIQAFYTT